MAVYQGEQLNEIIFPLGGIGSGSIGLAGNGRFTDWEIFNHPFKGSTNGYTHFAVRAVGKDGKVYSKILQGDLTKDFMGQFGAGKYKTDDYSGYGFGPSGKTMAGFPHFGHLSFKGEFPIAELTFEDENFPGVIKLTAFNPFIPLDEDNSSIPAAFFKIEIENHTGEDYSYMVSLSVTNPFEGSENKTVSAGKCKGLFMNGSIKDKTDKDYGDMTVLTDGENTHIQKYWYRGGWQDSVTTYANELFSDGQFKDRHYDTPGSEDTGTVSCQSNVPDGETFSVKFVISWNIPNCYNYWSPCKDDKGKDMTWQNYYAVLFENSEKSAEYALTHFTALYEKTLLFKDTLFGTTIDQTVKEAVSATISVLKSATVLRLPDGSFYGWEGTKQSTGSCEGTCTHVWNYNYALPFLFPKLEQSIHKLNYQYNLFEDGHMRFRLQLPLGREGGRDIPCVDGQMGEIMNVYREWKLGAGDEWLKSIWPKVKKSLKYAWYQESPYKWDVNRDGVLEGRQHHTLDMELFGPSSWLQGFYLGALKAAAEIAEYLGEHEEAKEYRNIYESGKNWTEKNLFNGSFYIQKTDICDKSILTEFDAEHYWNEEAGQIKYQIASGCEIDQICAQWHADIMGLGDIYDPENRKKALQALYQYNFKKSMREFVNPWRIFALNDESGTIMCSYPEGVQKPAVPVPYCEETMHGFEYEFAGLLMSHGEIEKGLEVVRSVRDRYNGKTRNPWCEIECGGNYARSMASYALIPILSGFEFDLPKKLIGFNPAVHSSHFSTIWSTATAWGKAETCEDGFELTVYAGTLDVNQISLPFIKNIAFVLCDGKEIESELKDGIVYLKIQNEITASLMIKCNTES